MSRKKPQPPQAAPSKAFVRAWLQGQQPPVSMRELCRRAGITESTLVKAFAPASITHEFKFETLKALAPAMGVSIAEIMGERPALASAVAPDLPAGLTPDIALANARIASQFGLLPHAQLAPNPQNPRRRFDADELEQLAESIAQRGLIQPLAVRALAPETSTEAGAPAAMIIAGHRRWQAIALLIARGEWPAEKPIPVYYTAGDDRAALLAALTENQQRANLNPLEEAQAFLILRDGLDAEAEAEPWSLAEIALAIGRTPEFVGQRIALVEKLCDHGKAALLADEITLEQARILTQFLPAGQMVVLRALDQRDPELQKGADAFRARAKHLVELSRNGGVAARITRADEAPRDESLSFDHQPQSLRDAAPDDPHRDNTQFIPPARDAADDAAGDAAAGDDAAAATAAFEAQQGAQQPPPDKHSAAGTQEFIARVEALETELRCAAAKNPAVINRLVLLHTFQGLYADTLGFGPQCLRLRGLLPMESFDDNAVDDHGAPAILADPPPAAEIWQRLAQHGSLADEAQAALAGLITLVYQPQAHPDELALYRAIAADLGIAWPDDLYTPKTQQAHDGSL